MTSLWNQEAADRYLPGHIQGGLRRYIEQSIEPGNFLSAVLCNDLKGAVGSADHINRERIPDICMYLYNYAPSACWGSEERFEKWLARAQSSSGGALAVQDVHEAPKTIEKDTNCGMTGDDDPGAISGGFAT